MLGEQIRQRFTAHACACVALALGASLVGGPRAASSRAHMPSGPQVAEADRVDEGARGTWFRIGDLLADVVRGRIPDRERERPGVDRDAEHVETPLDFGVRSVIAPDPGR